MAVRSYPVNEQTNQITDNVVTGIINCKRTKTFANESKLAKFFLELEPTLVSYNKKKFTVFVACL